jgi:hypothetical protein
MKQANLGLGPAQLVERQLWLQGQARKLIDDLNLLGILRVAGEPRIVGSFALGLMVWPDVDLEIHTQYEPEIERAINIFSRLVLETDTKKINLADDRDRVPSATQTPRGIYLGPDITHDGILWQVDIWMIDAKQARERRELVERIEAGLDAENRSAILQIKQIVAASDTYHRGISSVDIYLAVLDEGVRNIDEFIEYLARTNRSL